MSTETIGEYREGLKALCSTFGGPWLQSRSTREGRVHIVDTNANTANVWSAKLALADGSSCSSSPEVTTQLQILLPIAEIGQSLGFVWFFWIRLVAFILVTERREANYGIHRFVSLQQAKIAAWEFTRTPTRQGDAGVGRRGQALHLTFDIWPFLFVWFKGWLQCLCKRIISPLFIAFFRVWHAEHATHLQSHIQLHTKRDSRQQSNA